MLKRLRDWLFRRAVRRVQAAGFSVVDREDGHRAARAARKLRYLAHHSGHLETVSGRKPKVVKKVKRLAREVYTCLSFLPPT